MQDSWVRGTAMRPATTHYSTRWQHFTGYRKISSRSAGIPVTSRCSDTASGQPWWTSSWRHRSLLVSYTRSEYLKTILLYYFKVNCFCQGHNISQTHNVSPMATNVVLVVVVVVPVVISTITFPFRNRSSLNFAYRLLTIFTIFARWRIFNSSPN